jgi:hypothetical protein
MSISGVSSNSNSYLLYLLQQQQTQNPTGSASSAGQSEVLGSTQGLFGDVGASAEVDDGTYSPFSTNGGAQASNNNFWSDLVSLLKATESGDTASAQTAASAVTNDLASLTSGSQSSGAGSFLSDLGSLLSAVQSGNITSAQSAANAVIQDLQSLPPPPSLSAVISSSNGDVSSAAVSGTSSGSLANFIGDVSSLLEATTSGDITAAQNAAAKVESDLQSLAQQSGASSATLTSNTTDAASAGASTVSTDTLANQIAQTLLNASTNPSGT